QDLEVVLAGKAELRLQHVRFLEGWRVPPQALAVVERERRVAGLPGRDRGLVDLGGALGAHRGGLPAAEEILQHLQHHQRSSTSLSSGSSSIAISFSINRPQPGQQNWRNCGSGSMKRFGSPTIGLDASIGKSLRTQPSL